MLLEVTFEQSLQSQKNTPGPKNIIVKSVDPLLHSVTKDIETHERDSSNNNIFYHLRIFLAVDEW